MKNAIRRLLSRTLAVAACAAAVALAAAPASARTVSYTFSGVTSGAYMEGTVSGSIITNITKTPFTNKSWSITVEGDSNQYIQRTSAFFSMCLPITKLSINVPGINSWTVPVPAGWMSLDFAGDSVMLGGISCIKGFMDTTGSVIASFTSPGVHGYPGTTLLCATAGTLQWQNNAQISSQQGSKMEWFQFDPVKEPAIFSATPLPTSISDFMACHHVLGPLVPTTPVIALPM